MYDDAKAAETYLLRVAGEEMDFLEDQHGLGALPHVVAVLHHPVGRFALRHLQNLSWTIERRWRRLRASRSATAPSLPLRPALPQKNAEAGARHAVQQASPPAPIWIDVTNSVVAAYGGGIDRVAMQLAQAGLDTGLALPVVIADDGVRPLVGGADDGGGAALSFGPGITYVIVDAFWHQIEAYVAICEKARAAGAKVVVCVHDVIPIDFPSLSRDGFNETFAQSFARIIAVSDACVAVSDYSKDRVRALIEARGLRGGRPLPLASFRLGADGPARRGGGAVREAIRDMFRRNHVFLGVGTLEPKKGYAVALDAFDRLWLRGVACRFVIFGRYGWMARALEHRILDHPLYGRSLFWVTDASDAELAFAYRNANSLVQASVVEGFGLPIVEASREGTPVIASDIPIFRELAGDAITYFRVCDAAGLAAAIEAAIRRRPGARPLDLLSWSESLAQMVRRIGEMLPLTAPGRGAERDGEEEARLTTAIIAGRAERAPGTQDNARTERGGRIRLRPATASS